MSQRRLALELLSGRFAVCRTSVGAILPSPAADEDFYSWSCDAREVTIVCREEAVPERTEVESGWRGLRIVGQLDFDLTGILASLTAPLAKAEVSVFAISTFSTDYLFVKGDRLEEAVQALRNGGFELRIPRP